MANRLKQSSEEKAIAALSEWDRLASFKQDFLSDWEADEKFRKNAKEDGEFYDGYQWTDEELEVLRQRGQPDTVINRVKAKVDGIHGIQIGTSVDTKAYAVGNKEQEVEVLSERLRRIEDSSNFDDQESDATLDILIEGRAWYEIKKCWDGIRPYYEIERAPLEDWVKDCKSRKMDLSDAARVSKTVWMKLSDAKEMFPSKAKELDKHALKDDFISLDSFLKNRRVRPDQYREIDSASPEGQSVFCDQKNRQVRVVTTYYRTKEIKKFYYHPRLDEAIEVTKSSKKEMQTLMDSFPEGEIIQRVRKILNAYTFTWNVELELKEDIRSYDDEAKFPCVMMYAYAERGDGTHYGLVRAMKDPQRELNKRRSKALHNLSVNRVEFVKGAFENEAQARLEYQKPDGWIPRNLGEGLDVKVEKNLDVSTAQFQFMQQASREIESVGTAPETEGKSTGDSGREVEIRAKIATQPIRKVFNSLKDGRRRVALYLMDDELRAINEEKQKMAAAQGVELEDEPVSKYDVLIEEGPDTTNMQSEVFGQLVGLAKEGLPIPMDLIIQLAPMPKSLREKTLEKMQQQMAMQQQLAAAQAQQGASAV